MKKTDVGWVRSAVEDELLKNLQSFKPGSPPKVEAARTLKSARLRQILDSLTKLRK